MERKLHVADLWEDYSKYVLNLCCKFTNDASLAEDIRQEVFLRVIRGIDKFKNASSIKTWIYSITRRCCLDHFRFAKKSKIFKYEYSQEFFDFDYISDDKTVLWNLETSKATPCPVSKTMFELHFYEGWSYDEISWAFGFSVPNTIKKVNSYLISIKNAENEK